MPVIGKVSTTEQGCRKKTCFFCSLLARVDQMGEGILPALHRCVLQGVQVRTVYPTLRSLER